jgi:endoglycosylceramidase
MQNIVELANNNSIYIFHDMHQDLLTSALKGLDNLSGYDGIPLWLYRKFPACVNNTALTCALVSTESTCVSYPCPTPPGSDANAFFVDYFTSVCSHAFQEFYKNNSGSVDSWSKFWVKIAQTFGSYSNVLGYELINEPWFGDIYENPSLLSPGIAGSQNLLPVYTQLNQAIRTVDNQTLIFYEPVTYGVDAQGNLVGSGKIINFCVLLIKF